jgi:signal transduction histidine kinase
LRIGAAFAVLALVLFVAVGLLSGQQARRQIEAETGAALAQIASRMAVTLDAGMYERQREIQNLASLEALIDGTIKPGAWRALVDRMQTTFLHYSWIGVTDAEGLVIAGTGGVLEGVSVAKRPWFIQGFQRPFVGEVHEALLLAKLLPPANGNEPLRLLDFAAPIMEGGRTLGVLGAHLNLAWVEERRQQVLDSLGADRGIEIVVLDGRGQRAVGPEQPAWSPPAEGGTPALLSRSHAVMPWGDGQRYLTAAVRARGFQSYEGLGWVVLVRQPESTAMAGAARLEQRIWAFGLIGAAMFGVIGWWLAGRLTRALRALVAQAQNITAATAAASAGAGPAAVGRGSEEAQLALSLETLVGSLRQREQALVAANESLELRVAERTQALSHANADLQSFSRSVAHDIKGPIGSVGMVLKQLLEDPAGRLAERQQRMLSLLVAECQRMGQLVDELMTLAMVEQRALQSVPVPMNALVRAVLDELRTQPQPAASAPAAVVVQPLPDVRGDPLLLRQVWHNLLANALKFSARTPTPRVEVRAEARADEIIFCVVDNGAGFDMSQAPRLFEVFQRLHKASEFQGTGVGLSIVKRVVHRHGGRVWAHAALGQGAQFYFALPTRQTDL